MFKSLCRWLFVLFVSYPVARFWLGLTVRHAERLPKTGPAIIVANHNSHLDIIVMLAMMPFSKIPRIQPVAAADYFMRNKWMSFLSTYFIGIIPVVRTGAKSGADPLQGCCEALDAGQIIILFPEGSRGEPEKLSAIKPGIWHLMRRYPTVPVTALYLHGLGKSMPKGSLLPVPFFIDAYVDNPLEFNEDRQSFIAHTTERFKAMQEKTIATLPETYLEA